MTINHPALYWAYQSLLNYDFDKFKSILDSLTVQYQELLPEDFKNITEESDAQRIGIELTHPIDQLVAWNIYQQVFSDKEIFWNDEYQPVRRSSSNRKT